MDTAALGLTLNLQLCLAHYCDTHGPTPLMVTDGQAASCSLCHDDDVATSPAARSQSTPGSSSPPADALRDLSIASRTDQAPLQPLGQTQNQSDGQCQVQNQEPAPLLPLPAAPLETPPDSPRPALKPHDSGYRRTYDDAVTRKQGPCDNCAMTLPRRQAGPGGTSVEYAVTAGGPTLRTRVPVERVFASPTQASPPESRASSDTDGEREASPRTCPRRSVPPASCSSSTVSPSSNRPPSHVHYLNYTSTHEPVRPAAFSLLRASCLRALSFETLPRAPATAQLNTSPSLAQPPSFVTTQSTGSAVSGGPIFFGDALAGYTTAYIFRIPDVHARGHKRVYAFLALSTHKERLAMKTFAIISVAFRELAIWIQQLAEAEAERTASSSPVTAVPYPGPTTTGALSGPFTPQRPPSAAMAPVDRSESSFLTGGSGFTRRMGGFAGGSLAPKARGLAELVGQGDIFIQLHKRFVQLLFEVGAALGP